MPCTTRRTRSSTSPGSIATSSPARPTSSTVRTSACSIGRESLIAALDVPRLEPAPDEAPERLETGTQNHEGIVGAAAAVDFLAGSVATARAARARWAALTPAASARGRSLGARLWDGPGGHPAACACMDRGRERRGRPPSRSPSPATPPKKSPAHLAERAVFVSHGDFYAAHRHRATGSRGGRSGSRRLRLLHDRGGSRSPDRRRRGTGRVGRGTHVVAAPDRRRDAQRRHPSALADQPDIQAGLAAAALRYSRSVCSSACSTA